ncbi:MAG: restriction endonuclease subunit S [Candidatus Rokubacteria bacterium]|nr:restriction endonuclease subunit S [Candidatus Rokubacteria bacterium]
MRLTPTAIKGSLGITPLSVGDRRAVPPRNWAWRPLTSCARLESGHTPSRYHPEWWGGQIPWISLTDIRELDGKIAQETREYTNKEGIANSSARVLPVGTVVLSRTASVGFVTTMGREMATSQDFVNWVCGPDLDPRFLAYLFRASRAYLRSLSSGAIHQTIYMPTVAAFEVCLPDLKEQQRIVCSLDEQIAAVERARAAAEAQLEAAKAIPAAHFRSVFDGPAAQGWTRRRVSSLCRAIDYGYTASADFGAVGPRYLRITDIQDGKIEWASAPGCHISAADERSKTLADGDIVFARTGATTGKSILIKQPPRAVFASYLIRLRPTDDVSPDYLYSFFQSDGYWRQVRALARGGAQPNVNATLLGSIEVPVCPRLEQERLCAELASNERIGDAVRRASEHQLVAVDALPGALLRRAFSGEL